MLRRYAYVLVVLAGCKESSSKMTAPATPVLVTDGSGATIAELRPGHPCRATIGPQELLIGGPPLIATLGSTQWAGETQANGTTLTRDKERIARVFPVGDAVEGAVFDLQGIAQVRIHVSGNVARIQDKSGRPIRSLTLASGKITSDDPALTITGTEDLVLAGLLTAPELVPEVRMLSACERVLVKDVK